MKSPYVRRRAIAPPGLEPGFVQNSNGLSKSGRGMQKAMTGTAIALNRMFLAPCLEIGVLPIEVAVQHSGEFGSRTRREMIGLSIHHIDNLGKCVIGQVRQDRSHCLARLLFAEFPVPTGNSCGATLPYSRNKSRHRIPPKAEGTMARFGSSLWPNQIGLGTNRTPGRIGLSFSKIIGRKFRRGYCW